jgi:hypothetical protein
LRWTVQDVIQRGPWRGSEGHRLTATAARDYLSRDEGRDHRIGSRVSGWRAGGKEARTEQRLPLAFSSLSPRRLGARVSVPVPVPVPAPVQVSVSTGEAQTHHRLHKRMRHRKLPQPACAWRAERAADRCVCNPPFPDA